MAAGSPAHDAWQHKCDGSSDWCHCQMHLSACRWGTGSWRSRCTISCAVRVLVTSAGSESMSACYQQTRTACMQVGDWQLAQQVHEKLRAGALVHAMRAKSTAQAACVLARRSLQPLLSSLFPHGQRRVSPQDQVRAACGSACRTPGVSCSPHTQRQCQLAVHGQVAGIMATLTSGNDNDTVIAGLTGRWSLPSRHHARQDVISGAGCAPNSPITALMLCVGASGAQPAAAACSVR